MKGTIKVLNAKGHSAIEYDTEEGVVAEAMAILEKASYQRAALFDGMTKERITANVMGGRGTILSEPVTASFRSGFRPAPVRSVKRCG